MGTDVGDITTPNPVGCADLLITKPVGIELMLMVPDRSQLTLLRKDCLDSHHLSTIAAPPVLDTNVELIAPEYVLSVAEPVAPFRPLTA